MVHIILASIDPTIVGTLFGLLGSLLGAILPLIAARLRQRKRISYIIDVDVPLIQPTDMENDIRVMLDQQEVRDIRLLVIRVRNSGNTAIRPEDYGFPITFEFGGKVLRSSIRSTNESTLLAKDTEALRISDARFVTLPRILLNPKDTIIISIVLAGPPGHIKVKGRIIDGQIAAQSKM